MTRDDPAVSKLAEAIRNESRLHPDTVRAVLNALRPTLHGGTSGCGFDLHPLSRVKEVAQFDLENDSLYGPIQEVPERNPRGGIGSEQRCS